jgi:manganese efflux pump family protein
MSNYLNRLKLKWGITSNFQMVVVFIVFAITGSASLWVAKPVLNMIGITDELNPWIRVPLRIIMILPVYQVMLLVIGSLFGQFRFFLNLQKKWWRIK